VSSGDPPDGTSSGIERKGTVFSQPDITAIAHDESSRLRVGSGSPAKRIPDGRVRVRVRVSVPQIRSCFCTGFLTHAEAAAPTSDQLNGFGGEGFLRLGEPGGCLFLFCFAFGFPITRLGLAVPLSFDFALDRITTDLAIVFGGELVSADLTGHREGNLISLELAL